MMLFYAYLDQVEEAKKKAQPWECEVTLFPADDKQAAPKPAAGAKPGFACDETE